MSRLDVDPVGLEEDLAGLVCYASIHSEQWYIERSTTTVSPYRLVIVYLHLQLAFVLQCTFSSWFVLQCKPKDLPSELRWYLAQRASIRSHRDV